MYKVLYAASLVDGEIHCCLHRYDRCPVGYSRIDDNVRIVHDLETASDKLVIVMPLQDDLKLFTWFVSFAL
jgi:hypothetical protein